MGKLIDADRAAAVLEFIGTNYRECGMKDAAAYTLAAARLIQKEPAVDAVEVVRCKDCYYWPQNNPGKWYLCPLCHGYENPPDEESFCCEGVRKEDENNAEQCTSCDRGPHDCSG